VSLSTTVVWDDAVLLHEPLAEIWVGVRTPGTELPERATLIREACVAAGAPEIVATHHDDEVLRSVHSSDFLAHLENVYDEWLASGIPELVGQDRVVPYVFPTPGFLGDLPVRQPTAVHGRAGRWCYDTMTLVGPGTWQAARAAADAAQTAADLVGSGATRSAYALCRPPGHHVTREAYGGSCYLNNAAVAAETLRRAGHDKVAVVDVDAHHGNGTQAIFYERPDVLYASLHVDRGAVWCPNYVGFADETGSGAGLAATVNVPLAPGMEDAGWLSALDRLVTATEAFGATALVVSLGVDAALHDPESPLRVSTEGYASAGARVTALGLPTVHVQEGGYHLPTIGELVVAFLGPFSEGGA
jgi:acetoin utilization deacetylase AcuC-like enzyme